MLFDTLQPRAESELRAAFRALGAVTPVSARPGKDLPRDTAAFDGLLRRGVIREGAPGTFYLYELQPVPIQLARRLLFWAVLILTPIAIIQFCSGSP